MAVEAHHLHLFPPQLTRNREVMNTLENQSSIYNMQTGFLAAPPVSDTTATAAASFLPMYSPFAPLTVAADSDVTFNTVIPTCTAASRKRQRPFLGDEISSHVQQQALDLDQIILQHAEKVRMELMERRRRFTRQIVAAVEEDLSKRLKAKEEEIDRIGKLNWALEERIKSLSVENQIWRDLAQSSEVTANVLRNNLEQVLAAQVIVKEEQNSPAASAAADAESCCCGDNGGYDEINTPAAAKPAKKNGWRRVCRNCREEEPSVLLLPCRHLCLCADCAPAIDACPICNCTKDGSVNVNMS